ncbi:MAG: hypothetical protein M3094_03725, partial [Actinomycetia bacterium]|nr:hypothetical protein [Actinomycetes bacterium]
MVIPARLRAVLTDDVVALSRLFKEEGHDLFLVGGSVRDALLGREIADLDFTTDAHPEEIERIAEPWADSMYLAGKEFGTIGLVHSGETYEVTTLRSEIYRDDSRKPVVTFSDSIDEDLSRRDFTVNSMALKVPTTTD